MKKILKKKKTLFYMSIICIAMLVFSVVNVFAYSGSGDWSAYSTVTVTDSWKKAGHSSVKGTTNTKATFYVASKTMGSDPNAKLINSDGVNRSGTVDLNTTDANIVTDTNTGTKGYRYYSKVDPSPWQIGTDSIRYKIMAD